MTLRHLLLAALALAFLIPSASAQDRTAAEGLTASETVLDAPTRFTYSGVLTDAEGAALADGPRALVFRGYASAEDARAGAAPTWEESHNAAVVGGRFLTVLGSQDDVPPDVHYLTVAVDGEAASAPMRLDRGASAEGSFAPGNTLQDSYDNGRIIETTSGAMQIRGALNSIGLIVRDITPVFVTSGLTRFRLTSSAGSGRIWEYRVYGDAGVRPQGTFSIADATGGGSDGFIMAPGVGEDVLTLTGNTAQLGSLENQAALAAYTTPNPADPANGRVNVRLWDWSGEGGAARFITEDGLNHTRIEPDINGTGGFLEVAGASGSGSAFSVDGNTGSGATVSIAGGTSSMSFNTGEIEDASVNLPTSSVSAAEILNEAGAANAFNSSVVALSSGANLTLSRSITVPAPGYVVAYAGGELIVNHTTGTTSTVQYAVSTDCDASPTAPTSQQANLQIPSVLPTATYREIGAVHGLFSVPAGTTTFCAFVQLVSSTAGSIDDQQLTLMYVPTAYGTVAPNLGEGEDEDDRLAPVAALSAGDIASERAASVAANQARMASELAAMQARIAEIQATMTNDR